MIADIDAKSGIFASDISILNGSKRANEQFSGIFWQRDTDLQPDDLALAISADSHSDYRRDRDNPSALALLQIGGVQPQVGLVTRQRTFQKRIQPVVYVFAKFSDRALADAG